MSTAGPLTAHRPERVAVVIPAKNEAERIETTIDAARALQGVDLVVVVDGGPTDSTAAIAMGAGAIVVRHRTNRGKAAAMATGAQLVALREDADVADGGEDFAEEIHAEPRVLGHTGPLPVIVDEPPVQRALLFLDADMGASATAAQPLVDAVLGDGVDMAIALLPPQEGASGMGIVVRTSRNGIRRATGWEPTQPLSGTRCLTRETWEAVQPLAGGWGVETGLSIDAVAAGFWVKEIECDLHHRATGRDLKGQLHRAAQLRDVVRALASRRHFSPDIPADDEEPVLPAPDAEERAETETDAPAPAAADEEEDGTVAPMPLPADAPADEAAVDEAPSTPLAPARGSGPVAVEVPVETSPAPVSDRGDAPASVDPAPEDPDPAPVSDAGDASASVDPAPEDRDPAPEAPAVDAAPASGTAPEHVVADEAPTSDDAAVADERPATGRLTTTGTASVRPPSRAERLAALPVEGEFTEEEASLLGDTDVAQLNRALRDLPVEGLFDTDDIAYLAGVDLRALAARLHAAPVTGPFSPIHAVIVASHLDSPEPEIPASLRADLAAEEYTSLVVHAAVDAQNTEDPDAPERDLR